MLGTQIMISLAVLSLSVLMPAVARDLAIDPKFVGAFTAVTYAVASLSRPQRHCHDRSHHRCRNPH